MITLKTFLREGRKDGQGRSPLCFRVNDNGRRFICSTGIKLALGQFDESREEVLRQSPDFLHVSTLFQGIKSKARTYLYQCELSREEVNPDKFRRIVLGKEARNPLAVSTQSCFFTLLNAYIDTAEIHYSTYRLYKRTAERLKALHPQLDISKVGYELITSFRTYIVRKYKLHPNTANKAVQVIKTIVHYAHKKGLQTDSTIGFVQCPGTETTREFLSMEELEALTSDYLGGKFPYEPHHVAVGAFLMACYTGLRYADLREQIQKNAAEDILKLRTINLPQQKTGKLVSVPLTEPAERLIRAGAMNRIFTNQKLNSYLAEALGTVSISRRLTMHCGRHTFAVNCLRLRIPVEVVQQLLGHTKIQTTMIYAKVVSTVKDDYMQLWNKPLKHNDETGNSE